MHHNQAPGSSILTWQKVSAIYQIEWVSPQQSGMLWNSVSAIQNASRSACTYPECQMYAQRPRGFYCPVYQLVVPCVECEAPNNIRWFISCMLRALTASQTSPQTVSSYFRWADRYTAVTTNPISPSVLFNQQPISVPERTHTIKMRLPNTKIRTPLNDHTQAHKLACTSFKLAIYSLFKYKWYKRINSLRNKPMG